MRDRNPPLRPAGAAVRAAAVGALLAACAPGAPPTPRPVDPALDVCESCHMSVDDPARAAEWLDADGRVRMFDEPGCLVRWLHDHQGAEGSAWVADDPTGAWVRAEEGWYVRRGARTPMGYGVVAFADEGAARALAERSGGRVVDWSELLEEGVRPALPADPAAHHHEDGRTGTDGGDHEHAR